MIKVHLGVIEVSEPEGGTSFTVGKKLEQDYGVFSLFADHYGQLIADSVAADAAIGLDMLAKGQSVQISKVFAKSGDTITKKLHHFITSQEIERVSTGKDPYHPIPTLAAEQGLTLRTKSGKQIRKVRKGQQYTTVKGPRRPSFMYSGIFEHSLKAWVE